MVTIEFLALVTNLDRAHLWMNCAVLTQILRKRSCSLACAFMRLAIGLESVLINNDPSLSTTLDIFTGVVRTRSQRIAWSALEIGWAYQLNAPSSDVRETCGHPLRTDPDSAALTQVPCNPKTGNFSDLVKSSSTYHRCHRIWSDLR